MTKTKLLTSNGLELDCLILFNKPLITGGEEVLVYAQNRLVKGFLNEGIVAELSVVVDFVIAPSLNEELYEVQSHQ
jgi:hypothetical protein